MTIAPPWQLIAAFGLVLMRISAFVTACPAFLPDNTPRTVRSGVVAMLSLVLMSAMPEIPLPDLNAQSMVWELACEGMYGVSMGWVVRMGIIAVHFAGELLDLNVGYSFSQQVNPLTGDHVGPLQMMSQLMAGLLFFVSGGQHLVIRGLAMSLAKVPPGSVHWAPENAMLLSAQVGDLFSAAMQIAAPLVGALMGTQLFLALLSKVAPQLNIWGVGFAITTTVGLLGLFVFAPAWVDHVARLWQVSTENMLAVWAG